MNGDNDDDNDEDDDDDGDLNDDRDLDTDERIRPEDEEQHSHQHDFHRLVGPGGDAPSHVVTDTRNPFLKTHQKSIVFQNIFQMFVYNIHNGRRKTPLHMTLGHALFARDRNKKNDFSNESIGHLRKLQVRYIVSRSFGKLCH